MAMEGSVFESSLWLLFLRSFIILGLDSVSFVKMSTADDVHTDTIPNGPADTGGFRHHHRRRRRRPSLACSSGTATDNNSFYFSETDSDAIAGGSLPVALTDEPLLKHNFSRGSSGILAIPRGQQRLDCSVVRDLEDDEVDLESGELELNLQNNGEEQGVRCRICHLNLEGNAGGGQGDEEPDGFRVELGCNCKGDLGAAHKRCAETWFQIKGNVICEICGAIALNIVIEQENEVNNITEVALDPSEVDSESQGFKHGHFVMTFIIAFLVSAFIISYVFHMKNLNRSH